jgi:hypothetical protein
VVEKAEAVVRMVIDTYFAPNKTLPEVRKLMNTRAIDPLRAFSEECRAELQAPWALAQHCRRRPDMRDFHRHQYAFSQHAFNGCRTSSSLFMALTLPAS